MKHTTYTQKTSLGFTPLEILSNERKSKSLTGFTLIELLVVMTMTAIIATIMLTNYRAGEKQKRVSLAADGITSALTTAQSYALTGKLTSNSVATCRTPQYYYVSFAYTSTYNLYAHNNCGTNDLVQIFSLPAFTIIQPGGLKVDGATTIQANIAIYPPYGQMKVDTGSGYNTFSNIDIGVQYISDGTIVKSLRVDGVAGRIGL